MHYNQWNEAIGKWFFRPEHAGETRFLAVDDDALLAIAAPAFQFSSPTEAANDFLAAIKRELWTLGWDRAGILPKSVPGFLALKTEYSNYAVFWPTPDRADKPADPKWVEHGIGRAWTLADLDPATGELSRGAGDRQRGWTYHITNPDSLSEPPPALPSTCPRCDAQWRRAKMTKKSQTLSPLSRHRTGFQKLNQILATALFRQQPDESARKLVVFTDSRQDAAKLSAGIEVDNYRDLVRQSITLGFASLSAGLRALFQFHEDRTKLSSSQMDLVREYRNKFPREANLLSDVLRDGLGTPEQSKQVEQLRARLNGPFPLADVQKQVISRLLTLGINPAGPFPTLQKYKAPTAGAKARQYSWHELFDWDLAEPASKQGGQLDPAMTLYLGRIQQRVERECLLTLFAHSRKSAEALGLGWVTYDPTFLFTCSGLNAPSTRKLVDVVLRILGQKRRLEGYEFQGTYKTLPKDALDYCKAAGGNDWSVRPPATTL